MKFYIVLLGIVFLFLGACGNNLPKTPATHIAPATSSSTSLQLSSPSPTLTPEELTVISDIEARYKLYPERTSCIQAIDNGTVTDCTFLTGITQVTKAEWEQLFPDTLFYSVDISAWRSSKNLLPHETEDAGTAGDLAAWQHGQVYYIEEFDRLLELNAITITDMNRELVARSLALMSIPNYLSGEVRFLDWEPVEPGTYRYAYTHALKAWTQVWGCEVIWWFVFDGGRITTVTLQGRDCYINDYGNYIEDNKYVQFGDEGVPLNVLPYFEDYFFNR